MNNKRKNNMNPRPYWLLVFLVFLASLVGISLYFTGSHMQAKLVQLQHSDFINHVSDDRVASASIEEHGLISGKLRNGEDFEAVVIPSDRLWWLMQRKGVEMSVRAKDAQQQWSAIAMVLVAIIFGILGLLMYFRQLGGGMGGGPSGKLFNIGRSKAKFFPPNSVPVTFKDVAGLVEVKEEVKDIVEFLKSPERFKSLGAKIPRGILLSGDPGNGKTLLAKAIAGEASVPFLSISGSDFVEVFVGVGASRVRDLFAQARRNSPCIVFIDEIDAVGRQRGVGMGGGNDEREQTLNQLLAEMDGFSTEAGAVIVVAATNRPDVLDKALTRPGRFDRTVEVPYPDLKSRHQILLVHARNVTMDQSVDFMKIARGSAGFSGADLENLINEAALAASKKGKKAVDMEDFETARDKIVMGTERKSLILTDKDKELIAYHESGHALMNLLLPDTDLFHKVTIAPRGKALGVSWSMPERDKSVVRINEMRSRMMVCFGSMVSERLKFGESASGVSHDLVQATKIARNMVLYYGMSGLGPVSFAELISRGFGDVAQISDASLAKIDAEVEKIMADAYADTEKVIRENQDKLELLAQALLQKETLYAEEVYELLGIPPRESFSFAGPKAPAAAE